MVAHAIRRAALSTIGILLLTTAARADEPPFVPPGPDCLDVAPGGTWHFGGIIPPLPPDFFNPGSEPFLGQVIVEGGNVTGPDLVVERLEGFAADPGQPPEAIPIELVQLSLRSVEPITVPNAGQWHLEITVGGPSPGQLQLEIDDELGGTLDLTVDVLPIYTFRQVEPPFEERVYDPGAEGMPPIPLHTVRAAPWTTLDPNDPCAVDNFALGVYLDRNQATTCAVPVCLATPEPQGVQLCGGPLGVTPCGPPPNDACDAAQPLAGAAVVPFNTRFATFDGPGIFVRSPNVWFAYTAEADGLLRIDTCGSAFNSKLAVYDQPPCGVDVSPVATNDNHPDCGRDARVHVPVVAGQTLWIEAGGQHNAAGIGWLTTTLDYDVCDTPSARRRGLHFDANGDGARDLHDFAALQQCFSGPDAPAAPYCEGVFNTDFDLDIDFADVAPALATLGGPAHPDDATGPLAALCPTPGATINAPVPGFAWQPCPAPNAVYRLDLFRIPPGFEVEDIIGFSAPEFTIDGLRVAQTPYPDNAAPLLAGRNYAWTVLAYDANDPTSILCEGGVNLLSVDVSLSGDSLKELLDQLEKIRKELNDEIEDFEDNDLVKEVRLLQLLGTLLRGEQTIGEAGWQGLRDFINCDDSALDSLDATKLDTALEALQALITLILEASDNLTPAQKSLLKGLHDQIQKVRDGLDDVGSIKEFTSPDFDVWKHLQDQIKEGLTEAAKELAEKAVAKIAGKKAAGPIVSIVLDLWNFGDALFGISSIEDLRRAWNIIMLEIIKKAAADGLGFPAGGWVDGYVFTADCEREAGATWTISPVLRCWRPKPGGAPGEGEWQDCKATLDSPDGPTSKTFKTEDMEQEKDENNEPTGVCRKNVRVYFDSACPGPCYFGMQIKITYPDGKVTEFISLWGVVPASGGSD